MKNDPVVLVILIVLVVGLIAVISILGFILNEITSAIDKLSEINVRLFWLQNALIDDGDDPDDPEDDEAVEFDNVVAIGSKRAS